MKNIDDLYLDLLKNVWENGEVRTDRTGTGTRSVFGAHMKIDLADGFPLLTTKRVHFKSIAHELIWFLSGSTNIKYLKDNGVRIWDEWADENGDLGRVYGAQWRSWQAPNGETVDQISNVINEIKNNPMSRRLMVVAYNPGEVKGMALPPCHSLFQFYVHSDGRLSCQLYQRSGDLVLGIPFNSGGYALLTLMICNVTGLTPGYFVHSIGDLHVYLNHEDAVKEQLSRTPKTLPQLKIHGKHESIFDIKYEDLELVGYDPHPTIKAKVSV